MLVDTSVWIDFFNGYESRQAEYLASAIAEAERIAIIDLAARGVKTIEAAPTEITEEVLVKLQAMVDSR